MREKQDHSAVEAQTQPNSSGSLGYKLQLRGRPAQMQETWDLSATQQSLVTGCTSGWVGSSVSHSWGGSGEEREPTVAPAGAPEASAAASVTFLNRCLRDEEDGKGGCSKWTTVWTSPSHVTRPCASYCPSLNPRDLFC